MAAANGVATFSGLTLDKPGSGYTFHGHQRDGLTAATSAVLRRDGSTGVHHAAAQQRPGRYPVHRGRRGRRRRRGT